MTGTRMMLLAAAIAVLAGCSSAPTRQEVVDLVGATLGNLVESRKTQDGACADGSPTRPAGAPCPTDEPI